MPYEVDRLGLGQQIWRQAPGIARARPAPAGQYGRTVQGIEGGERWVVAHDPAVEAHRPRSIAPSPRGTTGDTHRARSRAPKSSAAPAITSETGTSQATTPKSCASTPPATPTTPCLPLDHVKSPSKASAATTSISSAS